MPPKNSNDIPSGSMKIPIQSSFITSLFKPKEKDLEINYSKRLKKGWRVAAKDGKRTLTVPEYLRNAPVQITEALHQWALLPHFKKERKSGDYPMIKRELEKIIRAYICHISPIPKVGTVNPTLYENQTRGVKYDLKELFQSVNNQYFQNRLEASLRWGQRHSRTSYYTTRQDPEGRTFNLITIAGVYNSEVIPRFVIEGLMYHEMLHIAIPSFIKNGRRVVHGTEFKRAEKRYEYYNEWIRWEKQTMPALLGSAAIQKKFSMRRRKK